MLDDLVLGVFAMFEHLAQLTRHRAEAEAIPYDIVSAGSTVAIARCCSCSWTT